MNLRHRFLLTHPVGNGKHAANATLPCQAPHDAVTQSHFFRISRVSSRVLSAAFICACLLMGSAVSWNHIPSWIKRPNLEQPFAKNPYLRAKIFNPFQYLHAKYWDDRPSSMRTFTMTTGNSFVVNLDRDSERMKQFAYRNRAAMEQIQRFSAHEWIANHQEQTANHTDNFLKMMEVQHKLQEQYPFLRMSAMTKKYGDAGCFASHVLLWKEKLLSNNINSSEYLFVFEDDSSILNPLVSSHEIKAPDLADVVFLVGSVLKRVDVPWRKGTNLSAPATRVIGGFGAYGYIITRSGAQKMLDFVKQSRIPLDIAFFEASSLRVFLPQEAQCPSVVHTTRGISTRTNLNLML